MTTLSAQRSVIETEESSQGGSPGSTIRMIPTNEPHSRRVPKHLSHTSISNIYRESYITSEYSLITNTEKLGGVYVIPSQKSSYLWFGVFFVHQGPFIGGVFRFTIQIPEAFPETNIVPTVAFQPSVFHPCVHPTRGTFDLRRHFKSWNKSQNHIWQILRAIKAAFNKVEMSTFNKSAHDMFLNDPGAFLMKAKQEADQSLNLVHDNSSEYSKDDHWIKFTPYEPKIHDQIRAKALKPMDRLNGVFFKFNTTSTYPVTPRGMSFLDV